MPLESIDPEVQIPKSKLKILLDAVRRMEMYQPIGIAQYKRDLKRVFLLARKMTKYVR